MAKRIEAFFPMKFAAITTFNREGLDLYGRRMMATFRANAPKEVKFRVYTEGWELGGNVEERDLLKSSPWLADFKERHKLRTFQDMRWDAVRFSHKIAAVCHAAKDIKADALIWIDGDVLTHSRIKLIDLSNLSPVGRDWIAWLDRNKNYPECGFFILNLRHWRHAEMIERLSAMYSADHLFKLDQFHDSFVIWELVKQTGIGSKSLSGPIGKTTAHPLVNGPLGAWFDHLKGPRKTLAKTPQRDLKIKRTEAHWQ